MIKIQRYHPELKATWNQFVQNSRNGTFLFERAYMEYHADRFDDYSLLFYNDNKLIALLPANRVREVLYSHQGLTYGGLVMGGTMRGAACVELFETLVQFLKSEGFAELHYKPTPAIYHNYPCEEDLYALFRLRAQLTVRNLSTAIDRRGAFIISESRRYGEKRAIKLGYEIRKIDNFSSFWNLLSDNLMSRFGVAPVHSLQEINGLSRLFPANIELYGAFKDGDIHAGTLLYITENVIHVQYISGDKEGKHDGALDHLFFHLINTIHPNRPYFEFGQSTEQGGLLLNKGLLSQKEGFGGRGIVYDGYVIKL